MSTDTASQTTGLVTLPPELVTCIIDFVDPSTLVDFACSSKFLAECSRDILKSHQNVHPEYRVCTDVLPTTLPGLLRKVLVDPIIAWHVRDLEFCYSRRHWGQWKPCRFETEEGINSRGKPPPPDYAFTPDERVQYLDLLRQYFHFSEQDIDKAREDFEAGSDAPLKLLLFALFPRIRSLKCSRDSQVSGRDAFDVTGNAARRPARSHLDYLQRAIILHVEHGSSAWPVGFSSLRDLAVGVETGTDIDSFNALPPPHLFADLMHLPGLESIYFYGLTQYTDNQIADDQDGTVAPYNVDEGSSSLQHIFLDRAQGLSWKFRKAMISGCKQLKSLAISNSEMDDIDALVQDAANVHADSMETLMFYETESLHGYRCNMFRPEALNNFRNLRTVYIDANDVMLDAFYNYKHDDHQHDESE